MASTDILKPLQVTYKPKQHVYGKYMFKQILPQQNVASLVLSPTSSNQHTYYMQSDVVNLSQCFIRFRLTVPAQGAGTYINAALGGCKAITNISVVPQGGQELAGLVQVDCYLDTVTPFETSFKSLRSKDYVQAFTGGAGTKTCEFEGATMPDGSQAASISTHYLDGSLIQRLDASMTEVITSVAANAALAIDYCIPFLMFYNTILALDRDLYFANQTTITITYNTLSRLFWTSTANTNPQTGAAACGTNGTITAASMLIAVQQDVPIKNSVIEACNKGLELIVPYVVSYNNTYPTGQVAASFPVTNAQGTRLTKVYTSAYPSGATIGLDYNKSNATPQAGAAANGYGTIISQFQTYVNSLPLQLSPLNCANGDDYVFNHSLIEGSAVTSMNDYYAGNWVWKESFIGIDKKFLRDQFPSLDENNLVSGIPLGDQQLTYQFNGISTANTNVFVFFVTQRLLKIEGPIMLLAS